MDTMKPESGYDKAARILAEHPDKPIEAMLEESGGQESDWLEFKAGMTLLPEDREKGETDEKLHGKYAVAIAAMANTRGGAFIIGVDDKNHEPVPLSSCDPEHVLEKEGPEAYLRQVVLDNLEPQDRVAKIKLMGEEWLFSGSLAPYIEAHHSIPFKGNNVIGLLVKPCPWGREIFLNLKKDDRVQLLPVRKMGKVGGVKRLSSHNDIFAWLAERPSLFIDDHSSSPNIQTRKENYSTLEAPCSGHFAGRERELEQLRETLESGKIPVVTGAGGTGKSELVRQYAFRHREKYPGGMFQIDMAHVGSWGEAWLHLLDRSANTGLRVADFLEIEKERPTGAKVRDALLRRARLAGPVFLALDNVESCEALFGDGEGTSRMFPAGLADGVKIDVVATARVFDASPGVAVPFPLGDLSPEASLELLLAQHPAGTEEERKAAERVAELLGHRALFLRRVPAILDAKISRNAKMLCRSYALLAKALEKDVLSAIERTGKIDDGHFPATLWKMTRDALAGCFLGDVVVRLVRLAARFPAEGFPLHILRRLWETEVFPGIADEGLTAEEAFGFVLEACQDRNIFQNTDSAVRIHRLDREAILRDPDADENELAEAIGRSLADYLGASPAVWLSLADFPCIVRQVPAFLLNETFRAKLLAANPELEDLCPLETLNAKNWALLLERQPQFGRRCPWDKMTSGLDDVAWSFLVEKQPQFADKCPLGRMGAFASWFVAIQPRMADKCPWEELDGDSWSHLLSSQPQFADKCPWEKLDGKNWALLLSGQPQFADECHWEKLEGKDWAHLLARRPQFSDNCPWEQLTGKDWACLLARQPQFANRCPWDELSVADWVGRWPSVALLDAQLQFSEKCPWEKLTGQDWADLLGRHPQFAGKCPWEKLEEPPSGPIVLRSGDAVRLARNNWPRLLAAQPQFAEKCPWETLDGHDWAGLLCSQPRFKDKCPWEKLSGGHWAVLLVGQPQFADVCHWEKLAGQDWAELLDSQPQFADRCPWDQLGGGDWARLMADNPQFAAKCQWEKLAGRDWTKLLLSQPQFADRCPWDQLGGWDWARLIAEKPRFATKCQWKKLYSRAWVELLLSQPQFADRCPWEEMEAFDFQELVTWRPELEKWRPERFADDDWWEYEEEFDSVCEEEEGA